MTATAEQRPGGAGFTLVEVLVAVALLGLAVVGTLRAMDAGVSGSSRHRDHAVALAWLQTTSDVLVSPTLTPIEPCSLGVGAVGAAYAARLGAADVDAPEGWSVPEVRVAFWDGAEFVMSDGACRNPDPQLQLITLTVTSPNGRVTRALEVVKSDV